MTKQVTGYHTVLCLGVLAILSSVERMQLLQIMIVIERGVEEALTDGLLRR